MAQEYTFENQRYGRTLTMVGDRQPTPEEVAGAYEKKYGGDLIFDKLKKNDDYISDLKAEYKEREGKAFKGSIDDLIEEEFEYWNMIDNNLARGGFEAATVFSDMSEDERKRTLRRFDVYDRTNAFGEGSRPFFEQMKGVSTALITDPTNLLGGMGLWKLTGKMAAKGLTKKALEKVLFPAVVGATYGAGADIERQSREIALGKKEEIDPAQVATTAAVSSVLSPVAPVVVKKAASGAQSLFKMVTSPKARETVKRKAMRRVVDTMGGGAQARAEATEQLGKELGEGDFGAGIFGGQEVLGKAFGKVHNRFRQKFDELGELGVTYDELVGFAKAMVDDGVDIPNITTILQDVERGLKSPSKALRLFRQYVGDTRYKASQGKGRMADQNELMERWDLAVSDLFDSAAERVGKGRQARALDKEFSNWQMFRREAANTLRASGNETKLANRIKAIFADPSKSLGEFNKLQKELGELGKYSGVESLTRDMNGFVRQAIKETLFENKASKLIKFAKSTTGRKTLKQLFPEHKDAMDDIGELLHKVDGHETVRLFWGRMIPNMLAAGGGAAMGGPMGAAIATATSLSALEAALKSKAFRKMALKAYSGKDVDEKAVNGMVKWLDAKGFNGAQLRDQMLGTASPILSGQAAQEVSPQEGIPLIKSAVNKVRSAY